ncbi:hypothetical protein PILCRDRAFT_826788 [Piloderma croceum F 1598]|uniref:Uncharacterized protein n=1 Tax=Piloderma croceum (strain F 1598) TaxID=765440 RepID=A0A0C3ETU5_PILCF|nr:hypothetical protein PILCRDRAFT_826788 [Piloderma croceum F 1598]
MFRSHDHIEHEPAPQKRRVTPVMMVRQTHRHLLIQWHDICLRKNIRMAWVWVAMDGIQIPQHICQNQAYPQNLPHLLCASSWGGESTDGQ